MNINDRLLEEASRLTGISEKTTLVKVGLEALISLEKSKRLSELGGSETTLSPVPRRRVASQSHGAG